MSAKLDHELAQELKRLPVMPFMKLLNPARAATFDVASYRAALAGFEQKIDRLATDPTIARLYHAKAEELSLRAQAIAAVQRSDASALTGISLRLYGQPVLSLAELEQHLTHMCAVAGKKKTHVLVWIDAAMFADMARQLLDAYGLHEWRIKLSKRSSLQVGHGKRTQQPVLRIPASLRVSRKRAAQLLAHEIEAHILRHSNGSRSPLTILERGTAGYLRTDEGIAMYLEQQYSKNDYHLPGFWEAYAVALALTYDRQETKRRLAEARTRLATRMQHENPERAGTSAAARLCKRVYRGMPHSASGNCFVRDHVYASGYLQIKQWLANHDLSTLYVGHVDATDAPLIASLGIVPTIPPRFLSKDIVHNVVAQRKTSA